MAPDSVYQLIEIQADPEFPYIYVHMSSDCVRTKNVYMSVWKTLRA